MELNARGWWVLVIVVVLGIFALGSCKSEPIEVVTITMHPPKAGEACASQADCELGNVCVFHSGDLTFKNGICTTECSTSSCAPLDLCVVYHGSGESHCLAPCKTPLNCRDGYICACLSDYHTCQGDTALRACVPDLK